MVHQSPVAQWNYAGGALTTSSKTGASGVVSMRRALVFSALVLCLLGLALEQVAEAQVFVYPRRPNKSRVRYFDFDWMHVDILVGEKMAAPTTTVAVAPQPPIDDEAATSTASSRVTWGVASADETITATTSTMTIARKRPRPETYMRSPEIVAAGGMRLYFYRQEDVI